MKNHIMVSYPGQGVCVDGEYGSKRYGLGLTSQPMTIPSNKLRSLLLKSTRQTEDGARATPECLPVLSGAGYRPDLCPWRRISRCYAHLKLSSTKRRVTRWELQIREQGHYWLHESELDVLGVGR